METTTFNGRVYQIAQNLVVGPNSAQFVISESIVVGKRGATGLLMVRKNGSRVIVWANRNGGRCEEER